MNIILPCNVSKVLCYVLTVNANIGNLFNIPLDMRHIITVLNEEAFPKAASYNKAQT